MYWANFLHIYQPADQQADVLEAVVTQCYRPLLTHLRDNKNVRLTLNINGSLMELFDKYGYHDLIEMMKEMGKDGRIEFTGSAKYHAFLPFLEKEEIIRQIKMNDETNRKYLGDSYNPKGFFPPEMGFKEELVPIIESLGFKWIILDEISAYGEPERVDYTKIYKIKNSNLKVFFRERRLSNLIMGAVVRSAETLADAMKSDLESKRYILTGMDGETFGHHRPGLEKMLFEVFKTPQFKLANISDLIDLYSDTEEIMPVASTWASSKQDIENGIQFISWADPENELHTMQGKLFEMVLAEVKKMDNRLPEYEEVRKKMDKAEASDHFWWASAKPWWSMEMIEDGAYRLLDTARSIPNIGKDISDKASELYEKIVSTGFHWQRSGKIREMSRAQYALQRIPFRDRVVGQGYTEGVYEAFIDMMKSLEKEAAATGEYEKATLWRDAVFKLENKLDIYDTVSAVDLLRIQMPSEKIEETLKKYKEEYTQIRGGQPEQRGA